MVVRKRCSDGDNEQWGLPASVSVGARNSLTHSLSLVLNCSVVGRGFSQLHTAMCVCSRRPFPFSHTGSGLADGFGFPSFVPKGSERTLTVRPGKIKSRELAAKTVLRQKLLGADLT